MLERHTVQVSRLEAAKLTKHTVSGSDLYLERYDRQQTVRRIGEALQAGTPITIRRAEWHPEVMYVQGESVHGDGVTDALKIIVPLDYKGAENRRDPRTRARDVIEGHWTKGSNVQVTLTPPTRR